MPAITATQAAASTIHTRILLVSPVFGRRLAAADLTASAAEAVPPLPLFAELLAGSLPESEPVLELLQIGRAHV